MTTPKLLTDSKANLTRARTELLMRQPFFGTLIMMTPIVWTEAIPTDGGTDGVKIYLKPSLVAKMPVGLLQALLIHEILHIVFMHLIRREDREPRKFNIAADYAINPLIKKSGLQLGPGWLYEPAFENMTVEAIYDRLPPQPKGGSGSGQGAGEGGDLIENPDVVSQADEEKVKQHVRQQVSQAAQSARLAGSMPGHIERLVQDILNPALNLSDFLRKYFNEQILPTEYSWARPRRSLAQRGIILPSTRRSEAINEVAIAIDNSGSIDDTLLRKFFSSASHILQEFDIHKVHVLCCDTRVNYEVSLDNPKKLEDITVKAGGGTDFRPPFERLDELGVRPVVMLYFTDLECSSYPDEPMYPVLWMAYSQHSHHSVPFGNIYEMHE